ncbi:MAG: ATP-binding protein [Campylobacter sp.]|nr:ATP-binding protein [Campylobacter sp.]
MKTLQENLKVFYLGTEGDEPYLYKNKDLTTHALIIGMTGSGKTGLGVTLLEEACIDNIPSIIIDPKGDLTNLALSFPNMQPSDFEPFIDPDEAANKGQSVSEFASATANSWRKGIENSYQDLGRVKLFKESADVRIYTPKSSAGLGVSLLSDFEAPRDLDDEALNNYILSITSAVMSLVGLKTDDMNSPESLLIQTIFLTNFKNSKGVSIAELITQIANPPFEKIGVFDVNSFFPSDKRMNLAMKINALIASASFSQWLQGEKLQIGKMLFDKDGKAKCNVFTISHLNDSERMFFVTLLLNEMINWMRTTTGTSSLRAILYMDEIYGFFPPTGNPPSKNPMLTLLKQARAFGLGCVLSTQNPVDLDYKGLSNIGTWFIGRLQTAQDKERVISGLTGVDANLDKAEINELISNLGKRRFLVKNINEDKLSVIGTRFALSYLKGPLSNEQISLLMKDKKEILNEKKSKSCVNANVVKPVISSEIPEFYDMGCEGEVRPYLYASANVKFKDRNNEVIKEIGYLYDLQDLYTRKILDWEDAEKEILKNLSQTPKDGLKYSGIPGFIASAKNFKFMDRDLKEFIYRNETLTQYNALGIASNFDEKKESFLMRLNDKINEILENETDKIMQRYNTQKARYEEKIRRAEERVAKEKSDITAKGIDTLMSIGTAVLGGIFGRSGAGTKINRTISAAKSAGRVLTERNQAKNAEENLQIILNEFEEVTQKFEDEIANLREQYNIRNIQIDEKEIAPKKTDIYNEKIVLVWKS